MNEELLQRLLKVAGTEEQLLELLKVLEVEKKWPKAANGTGFILYRRGPKPNSLWVGCASRSAEVGAGYGISFGGFAEIAKFLLSSVGTIQPMYNEAFREGNEELEGVFEIVSEDEVRERSVLLDAFLVRTSDINRAHATTYYGCPVSEEEQGEIGLLPPTNETTEPLRFFLLEWPEGRPEEAVLNTPKPLYHNHEMRAFLALAKLAVRGKLEYVKG